MNLPYKLIVIDDYESNNLLCRIIIRQTLGKNQEVATFTSVTDALSFIKNSYDHTESPLKTILFLDINMPDLSGWETLEILNTLDESIRRQLIVYILSSSIDPKDKARAKTQSMVKDFIEKPLTALKLEQIFENLS